MLLNELNWQRTQQPVLSAMTTAQTWCRVTLYNPTVVCVDGVYKMWYLGNDSFTRVSSMSLGYAESDDGLEWLRLDEQIGLEKSATGWDSEMICFGATVDYGGKRYMFYNGNNYGETGFGVAILEHK